MAVNLFISVIRRKIMRASKMLLFVFLFTLFIPSIGFAKPAHNRGGNSHYGSDRPPQRYEQAQRPSYSHRQYQSMTDESFDSLVSVLEGSFYISERKNVVYAAEKKNYFTAAQVSRLMDFFSYTSDRMEIACKLGSSVVDMENWYQIIDNFSYNSDRHKVMQCVNNTISHGRMYENTESSFQDLFSAISRFSYTSDRKEFIRDIMKYNYFTSEQVSRIMKLFSYSSDRIEVACSLASRTTDSENWFSVVGAAGSYSSDRQRILDCAP